MTTAFSTHNFAGPDTFLRSPLVEFEDIKPGMVVVNGAPLTWRQSAGENEGPRWIRESSLAIADKLLNAGDGGIRDLATGRVMTVPKEPRLVDVGDLNTYPPDPMKSIEGISGGVAEVVRRGGFSACLGGGHFIGYPSCLGFCRALSEAQPTAKVGYIHIDHHLDFHDESPGWGRYNSGTNARRIMEIDSVVPSSMVWVGIAGPAHLGPVEIIRRMGATIFTGQDILDMGASEVGKRAGELASKGCDYIYLSFDIDVIDSGFAAGTGSPSFAGITPKMVLDIMQELTEFPIGSMDLVETTPFLDTSDRTARIAAESLVRLIAPRIFDVF